MVKGIKSCFLNFIEKLLNQQELSCAISLVVTADRKTLFFCVLEYNFDFIFQMNRGI